MKMLYSMYDIKSDSYGPIFALGHDAVAVREFTAAVMSENSQIGKYPDDFELHVLGEFYDDDKQIGVDVNGEDVILVGRVEGIKPRTVITARQVLDMHRSPVKLEA